MGSPENWGKPTPFPSGGLRGRLQASRRFSSRAVALRRSPVTYERLPPRDLSDLSLRQKFLGSSAPRAVVLRLPLYLRGAAGRLCAAATGSKPPTPGHNSLPRKQHHSSLNGGGQRYPWRRLMTHGLRKADAVGSRTVGNAPNPPLPLDWSEMSNEKTLEDTIAINHYVKSCHGDENANLLFEKSKQVKDYSPQFLRKRTLRELFTGIAIVFCALPIQEISICRLFKIVEITVWNSIHHVQIVLTLGFGVDKLNFFLLLFSIFRFSTKNIYYCYPYFSFTVSESVC